MSIWSSISDRDGQWVYANDHDGYGGKLSDPFHLDVATAWGWENGIRLCVPSVNVVLDRENAIRLRAFLDVAIESNDARDKPATTTAEEATDATT